MDRKDYGQPDAGTGETEADTAEADIARLTADELAFLLRDPAREARKADRSDRANRKRTERRRSDPAYADQLRAADRERQRRRRARASIGRPDSVETPAIVLPDLTVAEAADRLSAYVHDTESPQARQLRCRPERIQDYAEAFTVYRVLAADGIRPTRGALAAMLLSRFGRARTPAQIQKLRDHVEHFAESGGPWHAGNSTNRVMADTARHAHAPKRR